MSDVASGHGSGLFRSLVPSHQHSAGTPLVRVSLLWVPFLWVVLLGFGVLLVGCDSGGASPSSFSTEPETAPIITADLDRFWKAFDASNSGTRAQVLRETYLDPGSEGLRAFVELRIGSADRLAAAVNRYEPYYRSTRKPMRRVSALEPEIRSAYRVLDSLVADAIFPPVYFMVGRLSTGGTIAEAGILIGTEIYARTPDAPVDGLTDWHRDVTRPVEDVPHIVAHELIHVQQRRPLERPSLLGQSLWEGAADFIGEMISGRTINEHVYDWAEPREAALWAEFQERMAGTDYSGWLYDGANITERPADLGYWMGYQIVEAYYDRAADKREAIRDILTIQDAEAFLAASGYAPPNP